MPKYSAAEDYEEPFSRISSANNDFLISEKYSTKL